MVWNLQTSILKPQASNLKIRFGTGEIMNFNQKNVFITGGSQGIGTALVREFCAQGARVAFTYRSSEQAALELEKEVAASPGDAKGFKLDVSDFDATKACVKDVKSFFGAPIDILVNNAGITEDKYLMMMSDQEWGQVINTNLNGLFHITRSFIVDFMKRKQGTIINVSSVSGIRGIAGQTNYSASKAGMIGFTRSLAQEVIPYGITVNAIAPGYIETEMIKAMGDKKLEEVLGQIPAKRFGSVDDVTGTVMFLASDSAKYITGQVIAIDGGLSV